MRIFTLCTLLLIAFTSSNAQNVLSNADTNCITIMTWNVKLLPSIATFLHHYPIKRAKLIPEKLIAENPDVISFQEAFDGTSIRIIRKKLKKFYPYVAGLKNKVGLTFKKAGGVIMFSKYPIREIESIAYNNSIGIDKIAHKGALLVEVEHPVKKFQLLGTHMQAGGGKDLKQAQYVQAGELLKRHEQSGVPQFACGDFNTKKVDTLLYPKLLSSLNAQDGEINTDLKATSDHLLNDMDTYDPNRRHIIDYVLLKENGVQPKQVIRSVKQISERWSKEHQDLSDHNTVILKCYF